jgi:hypothetical protein
MGATSSDEPEEGSEEERSEEALSEASEGVTRGTAAALPTSGPFAFRRSATLVEQQNGTDSWTSTAITLLTHWIVQPMLVGASAAFGLSIGYAAFDYVSSISPRGWFAKRGSSLWTRSSYSSGKAS